MARYQVTGPDGKTYEITAPDGASDNQVRAFLESQTKAAPEVPMLESLGRGAMQGLSFGFGDEIYGAAKGAYAKATGGNFGETYAQERDAVRQANDRAQEANPTAFFGGELVGGAALPLGAIRGGYRAVKAADSGIGALATASKEAAKTGAKYGAAYGLGNAEGDAVDQAVDTAAGALGGAAFGTIIPGAVQLGSAALRAPAQAARVLSDPKRIAAEKFVEAMGRDQGQSAVSAMNPVRGAAGRMAQANEPALMLADMGGENTRNLLRAANNMPNAAAERLRTVLDRRQSTQSRRLEQKISEDMYPGGDFYNHIDDLVKSRDAMAAPLFRTAFATDTPMTKKLSAVLERPTMQELNEHVARRLADEGSDPRALPMTERLHRMKLELDEQIGLSKQAEKMGNRPTQGWDTRTLTILKNDLLNAIDNQPYKYALKQYAGPSALKSAAEDGFEEALKLAPEQLAAKLASLSTSEAQMWRMGASRALIDKVRQGNVMRDRTKSIFDTPDMQLRLKQLFPNGKQRGEFLRAVRNERKMTATRAAVQGNSTTAKQLTQAQEAGKAARTVGDLAGAATGKVGALINLAERGVNLASGITPRVAEEVLKLGMMKDPGKASGTSSRAIQGAFERVQRRKQGLGLLSDALLPAPALLSAEYATSSSR